MSKALERRKKLRSDLILAAERMIAERGLAGLKTRAVRDAEGWLLNGSKTFITNGVYGDIYIVAARTDTNAKGSRGISLFIVEKGNPGLKVTRKFDKHGWRASDTAELFLDDLRLPANALLG